jgi:hypothetical protein
VTALTCGVSEKSATFVGQPGDGIIGPDPQGNLAGINLTSGITTVQCTTIVSLTAITTIYLVAQATYTGAGITAYGTLSTALL